MFSKSFNKLILLAKYGSAVENKNDTNLKQQLTINLKAELLEKIVIINIEKRNQRCSTLISELRMRNIDVDGIWHEEKLNGRINQLILQN